MRKVIIYSLFTLIISSCTLKITRTGYVVQKSKYSHCPIIVKRYMQNTDSLQKIGEIMLSERFYTEFCSEQHAIDILVQEGCALGADLINITKEFPPGVLTHCYQCKAEFYKFPDGYYRMNESNDLNVNDHTIDLIKKEKRRKTRLKLQEYIF